MVQKIFFILIAVFISVSRSIPYDRELVSNNASNLMKLMWKNLENFKFDDNLLIFIDMQKRILERQYQLSQQPKMKKSTTKNLSTTKEMIFKFKSTLKPVDHTFWMYRFG